MLSKILNTKILIPKSTMREKKVLSRKEIKVLWNTQCSNKSVKYGFLFSCLTGLRFCDIIHLKWSDIRLSKIEIIQRKTKVKLTVPLSGDALQILGKMDDQTDLVFQLPCHTECLKTLKDLIKVSGIKNMIYYMGMEKAAGKKAFMQIVKDLRKEKNWPYTKTSTIKQWITRVIKRTPAIKEVDSIQELNEMIDLAFSSSDLFDWDCY